MGSSELRLSGSTSILTSCKKSRASRLTCLPTSSFLPPRFPPSRPLLLHPPAHPHLQPPLSTRRAREHPHDLLLVSHPWRRTSESSLNTFSPKPSSSSSPRTTPPSPPSPFRLRSVDHPHLVHPLFHPSRRPRQPFLQMDFASMGKRWHHSDLLCCQVSSHFPSFLSLSPIAFSPAPSTRLFPQLTLVLFFFSSRVMWFVGVGRPTYSLDSKKDKVEPRPRARPGAYGRVPTEDPSK